jgi:hypothetical protein
VGVHTAASVAVSQNSRFKNKLPEAALGHLESLLALLKTLSSHKLLLLILLVVVPI